MNTYGSIIAKYRKARHLSQPALCELLQQEGFELTNKAVSSWETEHSEPSLSTFLALCRILMIEDIYEELYDENPYNPLSKLNHTGRERAREYIHLLSLSDTFRKCQTDCSIQIAHDCVIPLYEMAVSAGTGNFLDSNNYTDVERTEDIPATADFGVRISGDSMMPRYEDKQIIWVHHQKTLEHNEIGVFLLDGNAYCKKLQSSKKGIALISLNKRYDPIPVNEYSNFSILGKVLS